MLRGKSTSTGHGLTAAKKFPKKAVFCVDNVDPACDVDDVREFVARLSVNVISCFTAVPRRRRDEPVPIVDRKAFRLCIDESDRDQLLDASKWPDSVTISEWYYIPPSDDRRQRVVVSVHSDTSAAARDNAEVAEVAAETTTSASVAASATQVSSNPTASSINSATDDDMDQVNDDTTVLYHDAAP